MAHVISHGEASWPIVVVGFRVEFRVRRALCGGVFDRGVRGPLRHRPGGSGVGRAGIWRMVSGRVAACSLRWTVVRRGRSGGRGER